MPGRTRGADSLVWNYLDTVMPSGVLALPVAVWQFDGTAEQLNDRSTYGNDLSLAAGTEFNNNAGGNTGLGFQDTEWYAAAASASLRILGALTIEVVFLRGITSGSNDTLVTHRGPGEGEADNALYGLYFEATHAHPRYVSEHGAGVDDIISFDASVVVGIVMMQTLTRGADGTVRLYENGVLRDSGSITLPTGGASGLLYLGQEPGAVHRFSGVMYSMRITPEEFSAAQVLEAYNRARG
jgi:hypothetical protein